MAQEDALASMAVEPVVSGMVVGLGTGKAASRGIRALAQRIRELRLEVTCVATSEASALLARELGLVVRDMGETAQVDYLFDGADEVDPELRMIKGKGGAMTREKIVARASLKRVYIVQKSKLVKRLGERDKLPVEVMAYGLPSVQRMLMEHGLSCELRAIDGRPYLTDNGNLVLDCILPGEGDVRAIASWLDMISGVIDHGLFLDEADEVLVEDENGRVERMLRRPS